MTNQGGIMLSMQLVLVILYASMTVYSPNQKVILRTDYSLFQDIHVMVFIGFGFLMVFLKKYGYSAVGFNFLLAALVLQWSILFRGLFEMNDNYKIEIGLKSLYNADASAATVLISMGALLGRTTHLQLLILGILEIISFCLNNVLNELYFKAVDVGGSIAIHTFGAYFGLAASYSSLKHKPTFIKEKTTDASYISNILAMIGTIFLWVYWPSFNSIDLEDEQAHRAIVNTYLSLASSCVTSFAASQLASDQNKLDIVHIQNATLAGGVAIGGCAHLLEYPYGAILLGLLAGCLSVYGYTIMTDVLENKLNVLDTCGVHNLHGMPGILGGLAAIIVVTTVKPDINRRSPQEQAGYQALFLLVTILNALASGVISGLIIRWKIWGEISSDNFYNDQVLWKLPRDVEDTNILMVQSMKWKQLGILNGKIMPEI